MDELSRSFEAIWNKKANHTSTDFATLAVGMGVIRFSLQIMAVKL